MEKHQRQSTNSGLSFISVFILSIMVKLILAMAMMPVLFSRALNIVQIRELGERYNVTCLLAFGDSSVDPGNNNRLPTLAKSNFPPYGTSLFNGSATGRFTNGRLPTDFIVEALGYSNLLPAFLDPNLKESDLEHGVSFASAGSGFDDFTANITNVLPVSKQLEYFLHYEIKLRGVVGVKKAESILKNAIFLLSMGTNDFLQNYYLDPTRPKQFTMQQYQNHLASLMVQDIKVLQKLGASRVVVVGVPPIGCMPVVKTIMNQKMCVASYNEAAYSLNMKAEAKLAAIASKLGLKAAFVDVYGIIMNAITNPTRYGFVETSKGCCGTGTVEYADSCKGMSTCPDPGKYVFWDAVHPTEKMYGIIAVKALQFAAPKIFC